MPPNEVWFNLDALPTGTVHGILARWPGLQSEAATLTDRKGNRRWYRVIDAALVPLASEPHVWRPSDDNKGWFWPNGVVPEPAKPHQIPRWASIGGVDFDAAEAVSEMQEWRECARVGAPEQAGLSLAREQWWRDVTRVVYEPQGKVTAQHGEARIMRALILERSIRMDLAPYRTNAAVLAQLKTTLADVLREQPEGDWVPPLTPQPQDWRDFEVAMGWLVEVMPSKREMMILRARMQSPPATWRQIGDEINRTGARARQIYDDVIEALVAAANRAPKRAKARLGELKARNREAKR